MLIRHVIMVICSKVLSNEQTMMQLESWLFNQLHTVDANREAMLFEGPYRKGDWSVHCG